MLNRGYDDENYSVNVIAKLYCMNCGKYRSADRGAEAEDGKK